MITWEILSGEELAAIEAAAPPHALQCACGRFAKYLGDRHYYTGNYSCYSYTVRCSRCGDVTVECV